MIFQEKEGIITRAKSKGEKGRRSSPAQLDYWVHVRPGYLALHRSLDNSSVSTGGKAETVNTDIN